jgi:hypothetical protein
MSRGGSPTVTAGIGLAACIGGRARRRRVRRGASLEFKDVVGTSNRRMAYRVARSTCDGGRLKSGDVNPASPVRWCPIRGLGSFIELRGS